MKAYLSEKWIELREAFAYQLIGNAIVSVSWTADWELLVQGNTARLIFGDYNPEYPLVLLFAVPEIMAGGGPEDLEPENLLWSTYVGGNMPDELASVDLDAEGHPYMCGYAYDSNFPVGTGFQIFAPAQANFLGSEEMVVMKFDKVNKQIIWATWHGGSNTSEFPSNFHNGQDKAQGISVYKGENPDLRFAFITGVTFCGDFPVGRTWNQPHPFAASAYVHANSPSSQRSVVAAYRQENGLLCWSTTHGSDFVGYSEQGLCIDVDDDGTLAVGGILQAGIDEPISGYPYVTPSGAYTKGNGGGFFMVFNPSYEVLWCSPFGTWVSQSIHLHDLMITRRSIAPFNKVLYITGSSGGSWGTLDVVPSPLTGSYYQDTPAGGTDAYIARLDIGSNYQLEYSTYWGGASTDRGTAIAQSTRDDGGLDIFLTGVTLSADIGNYPNMERLPNPGGGVLYRNVLAGQSDGYLLRFDDSSDKFTWGTLVGGEGGDALVDVAVAPDDQLLITGHTRSFTGVNTTTNDGLFSQTLLGNDPDTQHHDAFFMLLNKHRLPVWSSYIGGTKSDRSWSIAASEDELYVVGGTNSNQFTFPLKEFDENSNLDWYDGNHLNNASGTHGGLGYLSFGWGYYTGPVDPSANEPDGFVCSFAISLNVSVPETAMHGTAITATDLGNGVWLIPCGSEVPHSPRIEVFDALGHIVVCPTRVISNGTVVDLSAQAIGPYLVKLTVGLSTYAVKIIHR